MLYADDAGILSKSPDRLGKMIEIDCEGVHGVRPDQIRSQDGGHVPACKRYANGEFGVHVARQTTNKGTSLYTSEEPSPAHPTFLWISRDVCRRRGGDTVGIYASRPIDRVRIADLRYKC